MRDSSEPTSNPPGSTDSTDATNHVSPLALIGDPPESRTWLNAHAAAWRPVLGPGARVEAFATVDAGTVRHTKVGASWLFKHSHIGHDAIVGDDCEISTGAVVGGWCEIGDNVRIGLNATIRPRVKVGEGARIGMGAVVTKDVPAGETWVGNPARNIDERDEALWSRLYGRQPK